MLRIEIAPKKPKPKVVSPPFIPTSKPAANWPYPSGGVTRLSQAILRDNIIKQQAKACPFIEGQVVIPVSEESFKAHGECYIQGIAKNYAQYGSDVEWPANNKPLIITAVNANGAILFTSVDFFKAK